AIELVARPFWRRNWRRREVVTVDILIEIARGLGLTAKSLRLDWKLLQRALSDYVAVLILKNTNVVVANGVNCLDRHVIVVVDTLRSGEVMMLSRADIERVWAGEALTISKMDTEVHGAGIGTDATAHDQRQRAARRASPGRNLVPLFPDPAAWHRPGLK